MEMILIWIGGFYVALCLFFYFFQHFFFFRPEILGSGFQYKYDFPHEELHFNMADGGYVNAVHFKVPNSRGIIYYLKGNSRSIKGWGKFSKDFLSNGYDFIMMDYRGFGKSKGKRSMKTLFNDATTVYDWVEERYPNSKIVVFGRSMGSGIAAYVASEKQPELLILDSPYYQFIKNVTRYAWFMPIKWLLRYNIDTRSYLGKTQCPIHIIHGTHDRLIPYAHSERLHAELPEKVKLHPIKKGKHNDLPSFPIYFEILYKLIDIKQ